MKAKDIEGLSPSEIQSKFAMPNEPTHMVDVNVPSGTTMRAGTAGPAFNQPGGGTQFQLMERIPTESFVNRVQLPTPVPSVPLETPAEVPGVKVELPTEMPIELPIP